MTDNYFAFSSLFSGLSSMAPTLLLFCGAALAIVLAKVVPEQKRVEILRLWTVALLLFSGWFELQTGFSHELGAALLHDPFSRFFRLMSVGGFALLAIFIPTTSLSSSLSSMSSESSNATGERRGMLELTYPIILLSAGGICFLAAAYSLLTLFIGLELCSIPMYLYFRGSAYVTKSEGVSETIVEASRSRFLRVFGYGLFSSLILLFGFAILYGIGGALDLIQLRVNISIVFLTFKKLGPALILAIALITAGVTSKMGLAPFHLWLGESHSLRRSGALPLALLSGLMSGIIALCRIFDNALIAFSGDVMAPLDWAPALTAVITITMFLTALVILKERSLRRILLWLAIAQGGFALCGVISASSIGLSGALLQTLFAILALAMAMPLLEGLESGAQIRETMVTDLTGLARRSPLAGGVLTLAFASLGALPFTAGFTARMDLFNSMLNTRQWWLFSLTAIVSLALLLTVIRLIWKMYRAPDSPADYSDMGLRVSMTPSMRVAAAITCVIILYAGISPVAIEEITVQAVAVFGL